jgi:hypothetical protein
MKEGTDRQLEEAKTVGLAIKKIGKLRKVRVQFLATAMYVH